MALYGRDRGFDPSFPGLTGESRQLNMVRQQLKKTIMALAHRERSGMKRLTPPAANDKKGQREAPGKTIDLKKTK